MLPIEVRSQSLQHWHQITNSNFLELECVAPDRPDFYCTALLASFGDSLAAELRLSAMRVIRRRHTAENSVVPYFKLFWQLAGESRIEQAGEDAVLKPGMWSVYDTSRAYQIDASDHSRSLVLLVPQCESQGWTPAVRALSGKALPGGGTPHIVLSSLATLLRDPTPLDADSQHALQDATVSLLERALQSQVRSILPAGGEGPRLDRIKRYLHEHLADPDLSVDQAARQLGMSRRTLYNVFVSTGTTPRAYIQQARLERACELLSEPAWRDTPVAEIARHSGFADPAHFSRAFVARHRVPPAIWRTQRLGRQHADFP